MIGLISKPNIAIRAGGDTHAHPEEGELDLSDRASWCDRCNLPCRPFAEPDVAVGARSDESWIAQGRGDEVSKLAMGVMRATKLLLERVNQKLPSAPIVIEKGWLPLRMGKLSLGGNAWEVGEPTQSASTVRPRVNLGRSVWQKAANIARADSVQ